MVPVSHSQSLWRKIRLAEPAMQAASDRFWRDDRLAELYPQFLFQLYHVMVGGLRLMAYAASQAEALPGDPVAAVAASYLRRHIEEEQDHTQWLLDDVSAMGLSAEAVRHARPAPGVVSLLGEQFFWISAVHPVVVFGYLLVLEGSPPLVEQVEEIERRTGLPSAAFGCLRGHAEDDPEHLEQLNRTLDEMPLTPEQERHIALGAFRTVETVSSLLDDLLALAAASPPLAEPLVQHG